MLNLAIMRHWENWFTIILMLVIASFAINQIAKLIFVNGSKEQTK